MLDGHLDFLHSFGQAGNLLIETALQPVVLGVLQLCFEIDQAPLETGHVVEYPDVFVAGRQQPFALLVEHQPGDGLSVDVGQFGD